MPSFVYRSLGLLPDDSHPEISTHEIYLTSSTTNTISLYSVSDSENRLSPVSHRSKGNPVELLSSLRKTLGLEPTTVMVPTTESTKKKNGPNEWHADARRSFAFRFESLLSVLPFGAKPHPLTRHGTVSLPCMVQRVFQPTLLQVLLRPSLRRPD